MAGRVGSRAGKERALDTGRAAWSGSRGLFKLVYYTIYRNVRAIGLKSPRCHACVIAGLPNYGLIFFCVRVIFTPVVSVRGHAPCSMLSVGRNFRC